MNRRMRDAFARRQIRRLCMGFSSAAFFTWDLGRLAPRIQSVVVKPFNHGADGVRADKAELAESAWLAELVATGRSSSAAGANFGRSGSETLRIPGPQKRGTHSTSLRAGSGAPEPQRA